MKKLLFASVFGASLFATAATAQDNVCSKPADQMTLEEFGNCQFKHIDDSQSLHLSEGCVTNCIGESVEAGIISTIVSPNEAEGSSASTVVREVEAEPQKIEIAPAASTVVRKVEAVPQKIEVGTASTIISAPVVTKVATAPAAPKTVKVTAARKSPVFFARGSAELLGSSIKELDDSAQAMINNPTWYLNIHGHASADGDDSYNLDLSTRRANAVYAALVERGVSASQLTSQGFGEARLKNLDNPESPENRRVEMILEAR